MADFDHFACFVPSSQLMIQYEKLESFEIGLQPRVLLAFNGISAQCIQMYGKHLRDLICMHCRYKTICY